MLVLSRKLGESISIGDSIQITVVEIREHNVRIGVGAPRDIVILRDDATNKTSNRAPDIKSDNS